MVKPIRPKKKIRKEAPPLRLNLACGQTRIEGFTGVDRAQTDAVDVVWDLLHFPWPFADGSVDEIQSSHFIEHIPLGEDPEGRDLFFAFMDEVYRVLKPGGRATFRAPYYTSVRAWQDPTHRRPISEQTFMYLWKHWREQNGLGHYAVKCDFDFEYTLFFNQAWATRSDEARAYAIRHSFNVVDDIQVTLVKNR